MGGLRGQSRAPEADVRERRNFDNLSAVLEFIDPAEPIQIGGNGAFILVLAPEGGLHLTDAALSVKLPSPGVLALDGDGLHVALGAGLENDGDELAVSLAADPGLEFELGDLRVLTLPTGGIAREAGGLRIAGLNSAGRLVTHNGSSVTTIGPGSNGQVLTADDGESAGLKWDDPTGTFLSLSDTPGSFAEHRIPFMSDSALVISDGLVFDAGNQRLGVGTDSPVRLAHFVTSGGTGRLRFQSTSSSTNSTASIELETTHTNTLVGQGAVSIDFAAHFRPFLVQPSFGAASSDDSIWICITSDDFIGIRLRSPQRHLHIRDTLRLEPRSSEPADGALGDLYVDSGTNKLRFHDGTNWVDLN